MKVINTTTPIARKDHICEWCGLKIPTGEKYTSTSCVEDEIYKWRSHTSCDDLVHKLKMIDVGDADGISSGEFQENILEEYRDLVDKKDASFKAQLEFVKNHHLTKQQ